MILVTGATGMVGAHLIWHLLQHHQKITATRRHTSQLDNIVSTFKFYTTDPQQYLDRIDWIILDLNDHQAVNHALVRAETVYHCAAFVSLTNNDKHVFETNIKSTKHLVDACIANGVKRFCFVSSIAACGKSETDKWVTESIPWKDSPHTSEYARSKHLSELEVWKGIAQGLDAVIVNPGVIIGASSSTTGSSQLFHLIKKGLKVYTKGGSGYVDVRDVVKIIIQLTEQNISGERFILVAQNCTNKEVFAMIADGMKLTRPFICMGKYPLILVAIVMKVAGKLLNFTPSIDLRMARTSSNRAYYDASKIRDLLHYDFIPISKSIKDVCEFMDKSEISPKK